MMAIVYDIRGLKEEAIRHYVQAATIHEQEKDQDALLATYNNLGVLFGELDDMNRELFYYKKAYQNAVKQGDSTSMKLGLKQMGSVYSRQGKWDTAQSYFTQHLPYAASEITSDYRPAFIRIWAYY